MPREIPPAMLRAMLAQQTGEAVLTLCTLSHASLPQPIRLVDDGRDVISRGATFQRFPFTIDLPAESEGQSEPSTLTVSNSDRQIVQLVRSLIGDRLMATFELVLASDTDAVVAGPWEFSMDSAPYTAETVSAKLVYENLLDEPYPAEAYEPGTSPGLYR